MELKENMYVRIIGGRIDKFLYKEKNKEYDYYNYRFQKNTVTNPEYYVLKASYNIIEL